MVKPKMVIKLKEPTLAHLIRKAHESYGFVSAFIYGHQGAGKTTYALKTLNAIYNNWDMVLKYTFLDGEKLISTLIEAYQNEERIKAILIDDAGLVFIKYSWYKDFSQWFSKLFNIIRTICSGVLLTSIEVTDIIKFVRDKVMYRVYVEKKAPKEAVAIGYKVKVLPSLEYIVERTFSDQVKLELPNEVRKQYEEYRKQVVGELLSEVRKPRKKEPIPDLEEILNV